MAQVQCEFSRLNQWEQLAKKLIDKYPERFSFLDPSTFVAYVITNKEKKDYAQARPYELQVDKLPMRLSNQFQYFVWFKHPDDWNEKPDNIKVALVISALERIDRSNPENILPLDYRDQSIMVRTFGINWANNPTIPNALDLDVVFKDSEI